MNKFTHTNNIIDIKPTSGIGYFLYGLKIANHPKIRLFIILPLLSNLLIVGSAIYYVLMSLNIWVDNFIATLPQFLSWLNYILIPLLSMIIIIVFSYAFSTLSNILAAPFNGVLAEKVEQLLTNQDVQNSNITDILKDLPRSFVRQWRTFVYIIPKTLALFLLFFIPIIGQFIAPILWFTLTSWLLALQYCDISFDNNRIPFNEMKDLLKTKRVTIHSFGIIITIFTSIPIINLFIMPIAVCGATTIWVHEFKKRKYDI